MKFLLVVYMFVIQPGAQAPEKFEVLTQPFATEAECNYAGQHLREITKTDGPEYSKVVTLSTCINRDTDFGPNYNT